MGAGVTDERDVAFVQGAHCRDEGERGSRGDAAAPLAEFGDGVDHLHAGSFTGASVECMVEMAAR